MTEKEQLEKIGYCILDNVLPENLADQVYEQYKLNNDWDHIAQFREDKYSIWSPFKNTALPQSNEKYTAKFSRSNTLENNEVVQDCFENYFSNVLKEYSPFEIDNFDVRCYKLNQGDHYRTHCDGFAGKVNLIYYVNKDWRWDWGGILNILSDADTDFCKPIFPKFNRVVLLNNKVFSAPHYVSSVENFALNPRYSIVSFNK